MNNLKNSPRGHRPARLSSRAKLVSGISVIAAIGFCPAVAHASAVDFGKYADAVQLVGAHQTQLAQIDRADPVTVQPFATTIAGLNRIVVEASSQRLLPVLSVGLTDHDHAVVRGETATFIGYSNYPAVIERSELRLFDSDVAPHGVPHYVSQFDTAGAVRWTPTAYAGSEMYYVLRVYDRTGNYDETVPQRLDVLHAGALPAASKVARPDFGSVDSARLRNILTSNLQPVIAYGQLDDDQAILTVAGQVVPLNSDKSFSVKTLQPAYCKGLDVSVQSRCGSIASGRIAESSRQQPKFASFAPEAAVAAVSGTGLAATSGLEISTQQVASNSTSDHAIEVRADGNAIEPVMAIGMIGSERVLVSGQTAQFQTYTNYPSYIARSEVRIFGDTAVPDSKPLTVVATDANGFAEWKPASDAPRGLFYVFRVYDDQGRFDETKPEELTLLDKPVAVETTPISRPNFGLVDEAAIRNIQLSRTATVTVSGRANPVKEVVRVSGQLVPVDPDGHFIAQQLVDRDSRNVRVTVQQDGQTTFAASRDIEVPRSDWFVVGQGDLTFRSMNGNGPAVDVSGDPLADGNSLTSRAAFYAKGKFGDGWKLTASLDTGETLFKDMFSNLDRKDPRQLLRRLDSNEYYSTYGDDSTLVEDAPTQGQFYLKLQKADSSLLVGNYVVNINQAELAPLDRGLFGIAFDHKSTGTTSFGERKVQLTAFASDPGTIPAREEFRGTGGSLYFLERQDLTVGSERVRVEVRDKDTGVVLETRELRPQEDYDIDYFQGRVTLRRPLASTASTGNTVRDGSSDGNVPVLVVRYEYTPTVGSLEGYTVGGRGSAWLGDTLRLGVTAQRETTDSADQTLLGVDAMLRVTAGTYLKGEVAQTDGPAFGQANSADGGLSFTNISAPGTAGRKAVAWKVEGGVNFGELRGLTGNHGSASIYYENFEAGFASASQLTQSETTRWGGAAVMPLGRNTQIAAKYDVLTSASAGTHRIATFDLAQKFAGGFEAKLGLRHDEQVPGLLYNSTEIGSRSDAALQLGYAPQGQNWSVYGFGQATLQSDSGRKRNNRVGLGAKAEISDRTSLAAEVSDGDGGLGADVQLSRRYGEGSEVYLGYSLLADRTDVGLEPVNLFTRSNRGTFTVGARHRFTSSLSIYGENRIGQGGTAPSSMRSFGAKFDPNEKLSFSASFENGRIDDATTGLFKRTAGTVGFGYTTKEVQFGSTLEARFEVGSGKDQTVWLSRSSASVQLSPDWRALGRFNIAVADDNGQSLRAADYVEGVLGFAYRPVNNDRLNVLARFSYFQDLGPVGQISAGGETNSPKQRSIIGAVDVNFDLTDTLTIGGKYGYRSGQVSPDRTSNQFVSSNTHLGVLRLDWRPVKQWDGVAEVRYLSNDLAGDARWGALVAVYRHLGNNAKIGIGYSFSDYSDDLTDQSYSSKGVFVNLLGKF